MQTGYQWDMEFDGMPSPFWRRLLVPTDFSSASEAALRAAVSIARRGASQMTLLHVVDINGLAPASGSSKSGDFMVRRRSDGVERLRESADSIAAIGLSVVPLILEGLPCEQILACAQSHDLVVMARTKSYRRWRWFARRTWPTVVANCPAAVLLVSI